MRDPTLTLSMTVKSATYCADHAAKVQWRRSTSLLQGNDSSAVSLVSQEADGPRNGSDVVSSVLAHATDLRAILGYHQHILLLTHNLTYLVKDVRKRHEADGNSTEKGVPRTNAQLVEHLSCLFRTVVSGSPHRSMISCRTHNKREQCPK